MAENKTKPTDVTVSSFLDALDDETRRADAKTLIKLMQKATGQKPKMWGPSIIGFGTYHYKYATGREGDSPLACFSPRKSATVVYDMAFLGEDAALQAKLGRHKLEGSCLHIKKLADVDQKVLEALIVKSVAKRAAHRA